MDEAEKAQSPFLDLTMEGKDGIVVVRLKWISITILDPLAKIGID